MVYQRILNIVPVWYSRTWLFIHSRYTSLHLLTPNSLSIPLLLPSPNPIRLKVNSTKGFPGGSVVKNLPTNAGDAGSI